MIRVYAAIGLVVLLLAGVWYYGHMRYEAGAAGVQAKWDAATASQTAQALAASESARNFEQSQAASFSLIANTYLRATTHDYPSIADALPVDVAAGAVRLRNDCADTNGGGMSRTTAHSRAADAAATQALADRVEAAIAAVRVGDDADARERELGAQILGLQAVLRVERK